jgi:GTP-binding protein
MRIEKVTLRATVADFRRGPHEILPMVAFVGRSNVGKSSLLNALLKTRLAAVSKQPGKTRTINYYLVNERYYFVDLPGYGYARTPLAERAAWGERITAFLLEEPRLALLLGLVDPRIPTSPLDMDLALFARQAGRQLRVVMTKTDKMKRGELAQAGQRIARDLGLEGLPLATSAETGAGIRELVATIMTTLDDERVRLQGVQHG